MISVRQADFYNIVVAEYFFLKKPQISFSSLNE